MEAPVLHITHSWHSSSFLGKAVSVFSLVRNTKRVYSRRKLGWNGEHPLFTFSPFPRFGLIIEALLEHRKLSEDRFPPSLPVSQSSPWALADFFDPFIPKWLNLLTWLSPLMAFKNDLIPHLLHPAVHMTSLCYSGSLSAPTAWLLSSFIVINNKTK